MNPCLDLCPGCEGLMDIFQQQIMKFLSRYTFKTVSNPFFSLLVMGIDLVSVGNIWFHFTLEEKIRFNEFSLFVSLLVFSFCFDNTSYARVQNIYKVQFQQTYILNMIKPLKFLWKTYLYKKSLTLQLFIFQFLGLIAFMICICLHSASKTKKYIILLCKLRFLFLIFL